MRAYQDQGVVGTRRDHRRHRRGRALRCRWMVLLRSFDDGLSKVSVTEDADGGGDGRQPEPVMEAEQAKSSC